MAEMPSPALSFAHVTDTPVCAATHVRKCQGWDRGVLMKSRAITLQFCGTLLLGSFWTSIAQLPAPAAAALQDSWLRKGRGHTGGTGTKIPLTTWEQRG